MGIPDGILLKHDTLTDAEWVVMKKHTGFAYEMLSPIRYLRLALDIPYSHHEKWDGSGYPEGRKFDDIPIPARLMALADVFDALISRRSYKVPMSTGQARNIIIEGRGSHFDPDIVDAFLANFDAFVAISQKYMEDA